MTTSNNVHHKSDFDFILSIKDCSGKPILWPNCDFRVEFYTSVRSRVFIVSWLDGKATNCRRSEDGRIHVYADNHGLPAGRLSCEFTLFIPDEAYPDGVHRVVFERLTDVLLDKHGCMDCVIAEIELQLPVFIGDLQLLEQNIGGAIDVVNRELEALLGREPVNRPTDTTPKAAAPQQVVLRRGYIPAFAVPGNAYRVEEVGPGICKTRLYFGYTRLTINFGRLFPERENDRCRIVDIKASADNITIDREAKTATITDYYYDSKHEYIEITFTMPQDPGTIGRPRPRIVTVDNTGAIMRFDESRTTRPGIDTSQLPDHMPFADFWQHMCALGCDAQYWKSKRTRGSLLTLNPEGIRDSYGTARPRWYKLDWDSNHPDSVPIGVYNQRYLRVRIRTRSRVSAWAYYVLIRDGKGGYWYKRIQK